MGRGEVATLGTVVMDGVQDDVHDIGESIATIMLTGSGFTVRDLGSDVPPERFVDAVLEDKAYIVGVSALLTTTTPARRTVVEALEADALRKRVKVMVGSAPAAEGCARAIGADAYGRNAGSAAGRGPELVI